VDRFERLHSIAVPATSSSAPHSASSTAFATITKFARLFVLHENITSIHILKKKIKKEGFMVAQNKKAKKNRLYLGLALQILQP